MDWLETITRYYNMGIYNNDPSSKMYVGLFVEFGKITQLQYENIVNTN